MLELHWIGAGGRCRVSKKGSSSWVGTTTPFDDVTLSVLYPSHRPNVKAFGKATKRALRAGFVLKPDAKLMKANAKGSTIGG